MLVAAHKQRPPLHPQEKWFLGIVLIQLVFLPWAFGTMHVWSQVTSLALSALGMVVAVWPRLYEGEQAIIFSREQGAGSREQGTGGKTNNREHPADNRAAAYRLSAVSRLLRFPLLWLGLMLLACLGLQALNPSWIWERNATAWWLRRVNDIPWLPTSVDTPFERFDVWRQFIIYATAWLTVCALWVGITRRRTLHIILSVLVGNAVILGLMGFVHKASGEAKLLWLQAYPDASSFASFVYQNHAGAYFGLMSFAAIGLAVWHFFDGRKRMARSTPSALWGIASLLLVFAVVFSLSRGAIISLTVFGIAAVIAVVILRFSSSTQSTIPTIVPVMVALGIFGTVGWMIRQIDFSAVYYRFEQLSKLQANDPSVMSRKLAREAAIEMYGDHWVRGVGAGGFRHLYPEYIKGKPMIYEGGRYFWEHAHNDWLEIPIELGLTGVLLVAAGFGWLVWTWFRGGGWRHPVTLMVMLGAGQVMAHAVMDFPFQNPAILVTWWSLLAISLRWLELEPPAGRRIET
jgi:O-antigen ligase